jgi:hypothetical protein
MGSTGAADEASNAWTFVDLMPVSLPWFTWPLLEVVRNPSAWFPAKSEWGNPKDAWMFIFLHTKGFCVGSA